MQIFDVAIVGKGLSGSILSYFLTKKKQSVLVFNVDTFSSTKASAGEINPITGKYFKLSANANILLPYAIHFYKQLEIETSSKFIVGDTFVRFVNDNDIHQIRLNILRDNNFNEYVQNNAIDETNKTFTTKGLYIHPTIFLNTLEKFLQANIQIQNEYFEPEKLSFSNGIFSYNNLHFKKIIFAEGYNAVNNRFCMNEIDFVPYKGQAMFVKSNNLNVKTVVKKGVLIVPFFDNYYWVGTENTWENIQYNIDENFHEKLIEKLNTNFPNCNYEIIEKIVGIRPSVRNRMPQCKKINKHENMYIFNGFGTKGFSMIPHFASNFVETFF